MRNTLRLKQGVFDADLHITQYFHCRRCFGQRPPEVAPRDWARISVGFTARGVQAWCGRCDANVIHIDFEGRRHPAIVYAAQSAETPQ